MEAAGALCLLVLLLLGPAQADPVVTTTQMYPSTSAEQPGSTSSMPEPGATTVDPRNATGAGAARGDCLIDTELGLIAVGSAGGLILCLLVTVAVLAYQVFLLQRRVYVPRSSRSNLDLVGGAGYWDQAESGGLVGPCDTSVILEEVRADGKMEDERPDEVQEAGAGAGAGGEPEDGAKASAPEEKSNQMLSSTSRDSRLEVPQDIEDMPLVV